MPGYGFTRLPKDGDYSLAGAAELIANWLEQEKIAPVWLVGHDIGGGVAQILAVRYPGLIDLLTIGDTLVADSWQVTPIKLFQLVAKMGLYPMAAAARLVPNPYARYALGQAFADSSRLSAEIANRVFWDAKVFEIPTWINQNQKDPEPIISLIHQVTNSRNLNNSRNSRSKFFAFWARSVRPKTTRNL